MTREISHSRIKSKLSVTLEVPHIESTLRILRNSDPIGAKREKLPASTLCQPVGA
jgi:hypothetical protein